MIGTCVMIRRPIPGRPLVSLILRMVHSENRYRFFRTMHQLRAAPSFARVGPPASLPAPGPRESLMVSMKFEHDLKDSIRSIPDYPKPGIMFRDITTLLGDPRAFRRAVDELVQP